MGAHGTLIYGGWLICDWARDGDSPIEGGAIYEENGRVVAIGKSADLQSRYPAARTVGNPDYIVAPGFINAHSHGRGLTTYQMGQPDEPLETRFVEMFGRPEWGGGGKNKANAGYDPYLDTMYSCAKQIASGITTTLHSHQYMDGPVEPYAERTRRVVEAYRDSGLRTAFALGIRDRSTFAFADDADYLASLPAELRTEPDVQPGSFMSFTDFMELLQSLTSQYPTIAFQIGPWNPVFCTETLMKQMADVSRTDGWRIQTHLMETHYQALFARQRLGMSWVAYLRKIGMLTPRFSGAHCVWFDRDDISMMHDAGAQVVHNPASNMRLHSGIAPVRDLISAEVPVAFGLDSLGMNDDEDMFQDLRLAHMLQATPGPGGSAIPPSIMLDMATRAGAAAAGISGIGTLDVGNWADVILLARRDIEGVRITQPLADLVLRRAKPIHVRTVIVGGQVLIEDGQWSKLDPDRLLSDLAISVTPARPNLSLKTTRLKAAVREYLKG